MKTNIQRSTFNFQRRRTAQRILIRRWKLKVEGSMFPRASLFFLAASPIQAQTNALPDLMPPYGELPPTFWEQHGISVVLAGLGAAALAALCLWLILRSRPKIIIPPEVQARQALEALRRQPEDGVVLSRVSQVVRNYFIAAFQLPPGELTTAEFSRALSVREPISAELSTAAVEFLHDCDARKFSPAASGPADAVNRALQLVAQAEDRRRQLHQPSPTPARRA